MSKIFLENSITEILTSIKIKNISEKDLLKECVDIYDKEGKMFKVWNSFGSGNSLTDLGTYNDSLRGIPFGVKDIFNSMSFKTEMGSLVWLNHFPGNNARVVDSLICSGANLVGKTCTAEFAVHELSETLNPHDITKTPGTSSSGSAVAVQIGNVPFALGSQTAGSIIRPASFCGVWGFKPSFGLVPRTGVLKTSDTLDTIGVLASHGKNLRNILDVIRVKGKNYPFVYKNVDKKNHSRKKFKIGLLKTHLWKNTKDFIKDNITNFSSKISNDKNIVLTEVSWPDKFNNMHLHKIHSKIYFKSLSYYFSNEFKKKEQLSEIILKIIQQGNEIDKTSFIKALEEQILFQQEINTTLKDFDCCITISTATEAPDRNKKETDDTCLLWTLAGIPAINSPLGYAPNKLPYGIQFISKKWDDYVLLNFIDYLIDKNYLSPFVLKKKA